jgi:ABC-2 type transport system permease protein/sodium transport system permease protein
MSQGVEHESFSRVGRLGRLVRKELRETLRDRRTLLTLVLMPLLLYPLLALAVRPLMTERALAEGAPLYRVVFPPSEQANYAGRILRRGELRLVEQGELAPPTASAAPPLAQPLPRLRPYYFDPERAVREGLADVGLKPLPAAAGREEAWQIVFAEDSPLSREAARHVRRLWEAAGIDTPSSAPRLEAAALTRPGAPRGPALLALVPLVLLLMTITGAVYPAIDLTAGERERGTLEVLMAAPVPRLSLLLAKYAAVVTVAVLTGLVNLVGMSLSVYASGVGPRLLGPQGLSVVALLEVFGLLLLFAAFFSAVVLALSSVARSFKEAQAYLVPLMVVALVPGVLSLLPGLKAEGPLLLVPVLNVVLLARDLLTGTAEPSAVAVVVGVTLVYALLAVALAALLFGREAVLSGSSGGLLSRLWVRRGPLPH